MAKQLNVNMNFTADTSNVESNLNKLKASLNQISSTPINMSKANLELKEATNAAKQLQIHLNNAFNVKTGNLDLNKLNTSLTQSGQSLSQLSGKLLGAGKDGQQAFLQMQTAVQNANIQIKKSTGFLSEMGTVLKNTIRWQLSSSMIHGFMSGVQQATGYVKDLNRSLTDIRIVTSKSTDDMAKFAEQANKSAKALSSTTIAYTDAALIYYQQGLDDKAVKERTDATIKMSNVTGQSAEEVSSYMTAIWNNFDDGSKSLEHYADVITALGASTASSSKEIAEGLEKFAAIGKTVGLSYDYATTALATVVAQTRQSADVVGTAFKTLFARIQDLELGETLDDGTTLGKYSQALEAVGVNIKDSQGNLKDMNTILDEMGAKWKSLSKDQQVALAQNVAGVRQYTQLVALMNNWDVFQQNLGVAQNSEGALQEQADIYAQSWEGASKRVKASMQGVYDDIINDQAMIKGTNAVADFIQGIEKVIDTLGGLKGILALIATITIAKLQPAIANGINNGLAKTYDFTTHIANNLQQIKENASTKGFGLFDNLTSYRSMAKNNIMEQMNTARNSALVQYGDSLPKSFTDRIAAMGRMNNIQEQINKKINTYDEKSRTILQTHLEVLPVMADEVQKKQELLEKTQTEVENLKAEKDIAFLSNLNNNFTYEGRGNNGRGQFYTSKSVSMPNGMNQRTLDLMDELNKKYGTTTTYYNRKEKTDDIKNATSYKITGTEKQFGGASARIESNFSELTKIQETIKNNNGEIDSKIKKMIERVQNSRSTLGEVKKVLLDINNATDNEAGAVERSITLLKSVGKQFGANIPLAEKMAQKEAELVVNEEKATAAAKDLEDREKRILDLANQLSAKQMTFGMAFTQIAQGASTAVMAFSSLKSAVKAFGDENLSTGDKIEQMLMGITMGLPMALSSIKGLGQGFKNLSDSTQAANAIIKQATTIRQLSNNAEAIGNALQVVTIKLTGEETEEELQDLEATLLNNLAKAKGLSTEEQQILASILMSKLRTGEIAEINAETASLEVQNKVRELNIALTFKWIAIAALVVAAVAAIGYGIYKAATQEEAALEKAKEATKELKEAADESQQTYETLMNTISDYKDAKNGLNQLTKGTTEWSQQVTKLNSQVLELMDNYEGLAQYVTNQNGVLTISDAGLNYLADTQLKRTRFAQNQYAQAQINKSKAENDIIYKQLASELSQGKGSISRDEAKEIVAAIQGNGELTEDIYEKYGITIDNANEKVVAASEAILANTIATEALTDQMANNDLTGQDWYDSSDVKGYWQDQFNDFVNKDDGLYRQEALFYQKYGFDYEKAFKDYAQDKGIEDTSSFRKSLWYPITENYVYTDDKGNKETINESVLLDYGTRKGAKEIFKDSIEYEVAKAELEDITSTITNTFNNLSKATQTKLIEDTAKATKGKGNEIDFSKYSAHELSEINSKGEEKLKDAAGAYVNELAENLNKDIKDNLKIEKVIKPGNPTAETFAGRLPRALTEEDGKEYYDAIEETKTQYANTFIKDVEAIGKKLGMDKNEAIALAVNIKNPAGLFETDGAEIKTDYSRLKAALEQQQEISLKAEVENIATGDDEIEKSGLKVEEVSDYANYLREAASGEEEAGKKAKDLSSELTENAKSAVEVSKSVMRMNKGIETLSSNIDTWGSVLKKSSKSSQEYAEAINGIKESLADVLGIEKDYISTDFVEKHLKDIEKVAKGDEKAIDKLGVAAAKDIAINVALKNTGDKNIQSQVEKMVNDLDIPDIKVGATIDASTNADFMNKMQGIVDAAQMTEEQANAFFESIGFTPEYEMGTKTITQQNPVIETVTSLPKITKTHVDDGSDNGRDIIGFSQTQTSRQVGVTESTAVIPTVAMNSNGGAKIKNLTRTAKGSMNNLSSSNKGGKSGSSGGGGGSKKSHSSSKQRYHTIDKQIGDNKRAYEALEKAKSKAYGVDKLKTMDAEIKKNNELIAQTKQRTAEIEKYRKEDKKALEDAAKNFGVKVKYDKNGNIANYDAIMDEADKKAKSGDEEIEEKYTKLTEAISQYEETLEEAATTQESLNELIEQNAQIELEKIEYKVDVKLELSERELRRLDYQIKQWERANQNGYKDSTYIKNILGQMGENQNKYNNQENAIKEILKHRGANDRTIAKFLAGKLSNKELKALGLTKEELDLIQDHSDNMLNYAEAISDAQDQIYAIFGENLDVYQNEYDKQIKAIEHQKNVVSGLKEVFTLIEQGNAQLLQQMRDSVKEASLTEGLAAKQNMENVKAEMIRMQKLRDEAAASGNDALVASLDSQLDAYQDYYNEQEEAYISALQETLEIIKENLAVSLEDLSKEYQKGISGVYGTFGALEMAMDMNEEVRNSVLAPYQKAYELSKLTRDIQKSIDETDNIKAKQTLLKLENKINAARAEGVELTQYDLDAMRAEYDLEVAKIALEEAQNAKNTVRMQRDSNGNWSYVYTADEDKIADAQQKYEDAVYAMRKLDDERLYEIQRQVIEVYKQLDERIKEILSDDTLNEAEKEKLIKDAETTAKTQLEVFGKEMQRVIDNQKYFYETEAENYHRFTGRNIDELGRWNTAFEDTFLGKATKYKDGEEMVDSLETSINKYVEDATKAFEEAKKQEEDAMKQFNIDVNTATEATNKLNETLKTTVDTIKELGKALADADTATLAGISDASGKYQVTIDGADETFGAISLNIQKLAGFDTGGYTGEWSNNNGKLAFLHQKELVLNEMQTKDLLETIRLLENYILPTIRLTKLDSLNKKNDILDQNVMIQAEFPNVTNHLEIEEAFNNLINTASQYANRK